MPDVPNTFLIQFVDSPQTVFYNQDGEGFLRLTPEPSGTTAFDLTGFRKFSVMVGAASAKSMLVYQGKISGTTLSFDTEVSLDEEIHTFDVVGPEGTIVLIGGPPGTSESVQFWIYLRS